jgi:hypothetical protein
MADLRQRYADKIVGVISCFDRIVIQGTLPQLCYAEGMAGYLNARGIRLFDYPRFAQPFRDRIRENAECIAAEHGVEITFVRRASTRKEKLVADILAQRGSTPGLVCILSAMERCTSYKPWFDAKKQLAISL